MSNKLVPVDYENVQRIDLSMLDDSYRAIVFVGANQQPPKAARCPAMAHRFSVRDGPQTVCFVLSQDKGDDRFCCT